MNKTPRVWLLTAHIGAGHLQAARAITEALSGRGVVPITIDTMQAVPRWFRALYAGGYTHMVTRAPLLMGWLHDHMDLARPMLPDRIRALIEAHVLRRLRRRLSDDRPDWIIHTHFVSCGVVSRWVAQGGRRIRQAVVVTDTYPHRLWSAPGIDRYFVPTDHARACLLSNGISADQIDVSGIPILAKHAVSIDRDAARRECAWPTDRPVLLVIAGAEFVVGPVEQTVDALARAFPHALLQVVAGHNERLASRLRARHAGHRSVRVIGFTDRMPQLLAGATLVLSKPGGLITSESLAAGAAMVSLFPIPGHEMANADYLLERGAGLKVMRPREVVPTVQYALQTPGLIDRLRDGARRLAKPDAAAIVAGYIACDAPAPSVDVYDRSFPPALIGAA